VACLAFIVLVLAGVPLAISSLACAGVLVAAFLIWDRSVFAWKMIPFRLLVFVTGLFLLVQVIDRYWLVHLLGGVMSAGNNVEGVTKTALLGAILANGINNLPAYAVGELVVANTDQLLALLVSINVSPLITPWASLAIIIWYQRCRSAGVRIGWGRFAVTGAVTAVVTLIAAEGALLLSGG
jgi:arsenical pump membrane protein